MYRCIIQMISSFNGVCAADVTNVFWLQLINMLITIPYSSTLLWQKTFVISWILFPKWIFCDKTFVKSRIFCEWTPSVIHPCLMWLNIHEKFFVIPFTVTKIIKVFYLESLELYGKWCQTIYIGSTSTFNYLNHICTYQGWKWVGWPGQSGSLWSLFWRVKWVSSAH